MSPFTSFIIFKQVHFTFEITVAMLPLFGRLAEFDTVIADED